MAAGVDYGMGVTNVDPKTGIRFGVIPQNEVVQAWADESTPQYGPPTCGYCGSEDLNEVSAFYVRCRDCDEEMREEETQPEEPLAYTYHDSEYDVEQHSGDSDLFVLRSPYYSVSRFCSPCAPGAGYLMQPDEDGVATYCLGPDWFENEQPPYPVYLVSTDFCVYRPE